MQLAYWIIALGCLWVLRSCWQVWCLVHEANPHRAITHFAQHQVLLIGLIAAFCTGLCSVTVYSTDEYGMLSRWWAMFDAFVLITMYSWLGYLKRSLSAGRQG